MTAAKVQISVGLLEKLAGIKKEPPKGQKQQQQHTSHPGLPFGLPVLPHGHHSHDLAVPFPADSSLRQSLKQSQRIGELLLKTEEQELAAVKQRADELINKYSAVMRPVSCGAEQQACIDCYKQHPQDVLQCAQLVAAYAACAQQAAGQLMT